MKINTTFLCLNLFLVFFCYESNGEKHSFWGIRRFITEASPPQDISPVPGPVPDAKDLKANPNDGDKSTNDKSKDLQASNDPGKSNPKSSDNDGNRTATAAPPTELKSNPESSTNDGNKTPIAGPPTELKLNPESSTKEANKTAIAGPPTELKSDPESSTNDDNKTPIARPPTELKSNPETSNNNDNKTSIEGPPTKLPAGTEKNDAEKEKNDGNTDLKSGSNGKCEGSTAPCRLLKNLTACIQRLESGSNGLVLLIVNEGEIPLKVNVTIPTSLPTVADEHVIIKKKSEKISISPSVTQGSEIFLKAGDDECTLHVGPVTIQGNFFQQLPFYYKQITPLYIAYVIFLATLVIGGTCACCQLRKKKRQDGEVPYQELEMGISQSASATNVETADGWDDGWDDDWDDDKAAKPQGQRSVGISANGLTARSSKQDGWGNDWDD